MSNLSIYLLERADKEPEVLIFINTPVTFLLICVLCLIETDWMKEQCFLRKVSASQVTCQDKRTLIHRTAAVTWIWKQAAAVL